MGKEAETVDTVRERERERERELYFSKQREDFVQQSDTRLLNETNKREKKKTKET